MLRTSLSEGPTLTEADTIPSNGTAKPEDDDTGLNPREISSAAKRLAIVALRVAGVQWRIIAEFFGISTRHAQGLAYSEDAKLAMKTIRQLAKQELVESSLIIQRRYLKAMKTLPIDKDNATAHSRYATAIGVITEKASLAAGEATARTESVHIALNLSEKQARLAELRQARELAQGRRPVAEIADGTD